MKKLIIFIFSIVLLESCDKEVEGCTDINATNYNSEATIDDGSCIVIGCTDPNAINYNPDAVEDSGNCLFTLVGSWEGVYWIQNGNNIIQNLLCKLFPLTGDNTRVKFVRIASNLGEIKSLLEVISWLKNKGFKVFINKFSSMQR